MNIENNILELESILDPWKIRIGEDYLGYRHHVYRMLHFCFYLHKPDEEERHKFIIAAAHHDIGIWSENTVDYLTPSIEEAKLFLESNKLDFWTDEISLMIDMHHKVTAYRSDKFSLVEIFRRADWADFSLGIIRSSIPKSFIQEVNAVFPNAGFHEMLLRIALQRIKKYPFSPAPMLKF